MCFSFKCAGFVRRVAIKSSIKKHVFLKTVNEKNLLNKQNQ